MIARLGRMWAIGAFVAGCAFDAPCPEGFGSYAPTYVPARSTCPADWRPPRCMTREVPSGDDACAIGLISHCTNGIQATWYVPHDGTPGRVVYRDPSGCRAEFVLYQTGPE